MIHGYLHRILFDMRTSVKTIGIVSTARKISPAEVQPAIDFLSAKGFRVKISPYLFETENQFAGNDRVRAKAMQEMLDDEEADAILCARGGYGTVRILEYLDWEGFRKHPKLICGYSDVTVLHAHINFVLGVSTLHGIMPINMKETDADTATSNEALVKALAGIYDPLPLPAYTLNKPGNARGKLVGGNLSVLYSLLGSESFGDTENCILFLEDLDEYLYHIDRMLMALDRAGKLSRLSALLVGSFTDMKDNTVPFGKTSEEIIADITSKYSYPVYMQLPVGHSKLNLPLNLGAAYEIKENVLRPAQD